MDDFIQSKQVDKAVTFHDPLKRLTFASKCVIKRDNVKTILLLIYYFKLHMLHSLTCVLILET